MHVLYWIKVLSNEFYQEVAFQSYHLCASSNMTGNHRSSFLKDVSMCVVDWRRIDQRQISYQQLTIFQVALWNLKTMCQIISQINSIWWIIVPCLTVTGVLAACLSGAKTFPEPMMTYNRSTGTNNEIWIENTNISLKTLPLKMSAKGARFG